MPICTPDICLLAMILKQSLLTIGVEFAAASQNLTVDIHG